MALVIVRHAVRRSVGEAYEYLSRLAASGGTMLVRVRISDGIERAHPVMIDERLPISGGATGWWSSWSERLGIPASAGTVVVKAADDGSAILEFSGACTSPTFAHETSDDVFAFRRATALAREYLAALCEGIEATEAA